MTQPTIRPERPEDFDAIHDVVTQAFGRKDEAELVRKLRDGAGYVPDLAYVALKDETIVGHIMLSYALIGRKRVLQLAPLSVVPAEQKTGVGTDLMRRALEDADQQGEPLVLVLGHAEYYPRFGFVPARPLGIESDIQGLPDEVWMLKKLSNYDDKIRGTAVFPPAI